MINALMFTRALLSVYLTRVLLLTILVSSTYISFYCSIFLNFTLLFGYFTFLLRCTKNSKLSVVGKDKFAGRRAIFQICPVEFRLNTNVADNFGGINEINDGCEVANCVSVAQMDLLNNVIFAEEMKLHSTGCSR